MYRKPIFLISFVFVLGLVLSSPAEAVDPDLLVWYKFDEGTGTTATDSSNYGHDGVITGATWVTGGQLGGALDFDGAGDYVEDADGGTYLNGLSALTVAMWIKSDVTNSNKGFIIGMQPAGGDRPIAMRYDSVGSSGGGTNLLKMGVASSDRLGQDGQQIESSNDSQTTEWCHVCLTWNTGVPMTFYINGVEDTPTDRNRENQGGTTSDNTTLIIGRGGKDENATTQGWDGLIDDVQIYSRALTVEEIQAVMLGIMHDPNIASGPYPSNGAIVAPGPIDCTWTGGQNAATHEVYFGTDPCDLNGPFIKPRGEPNYAPPGGAAPATTYYWRVDEVNTLHGSSPWVGNVWSFSTYQEAGMGKITFDVWRNIPTADLPNLTSHPNYPDSPDETGYRTMFEGPRNYAGDFGARMHGWLMPETSGDYTFFVASDDDSELWLSTDMERKNAELICWEYGVSGWRNWNPGGTETSAPITLVGGQKYYISGIWKEGGGGDYLSVAWQGPDQPDAPVDGSADAVIKGWYLFPFVQYWASNPTPDDGSSIDGESYPPNIYVTLKFDAGVDANTHEVFFSDDIAKVIARDPTVSLGEAADGNFPTTYYAGVPLPDWTPYTDSLVRGTTYYWCADETDNQARLWQGDVWSFAVRTDKASNPDPVHEETLVSTTKVLSWSQGVETGYGIPHEHDVYFGTNWADVNNGVYTDPPVAPFWGKQLFGLESWDPNANGGLPPLDYETDYYWRIDEVHGRKFTFPPTPGTIIPGDVWKFTTIRETGGVRGYYYQWPFTTGDPIPPARETVFDPGNFVLTRIDPEINWNWGNPGSPDPCIAPDEFGCRWVGKVEIGRTDTYTFNGRTDDGIRLWIDGQLIIDDWDQGGMRNNYSTPVDLVAGQKYSLVMEQYEHQGGAGAELYWLSPHIPEQIIPSGALYPPYWAYDPYPADGDRLVDPTEVAACTWAPGDLAAQHKVYWGTNPTALAYRVTKSRGDETFLPTEGIDFVMTYYWRVDEVNDANLWVGDVWTFSTVRAEGHGTITAEGWLGISGTNLDILKSHPAYLADQPDYSIEITSFDTGTTLGDNYGGRVHGWLVPETSGLYNFWLTTDDQGELYLSENYPPGPGDLIAYVEDPPPAIGTGYAGPYIWDKFPTQDSNNVVGLKWLNADQPYYILALWKEGGGGDHCMVAWKGPDQPNDVVNGSSEGIIDGWFLMPFTRLWASNPNPYHQQELGAEQVTLLTWLPGIEAATHDVYFGTSLSAVDEFAPPVSPAQALDVNYYDPTIALGGPVEWETTYYWRIDEVNGVEEWTGRIWTFKTTNYTVLDDFEPYLSTEAASDPNALRYVWRDGYYFYLPPAKSGSNILLTGIAEHPPLYPTPKPYLHWDDYHDFYGAQGLAVYYDNDGNTIVPGKPTNIYETPKFSEIEATTDGLGVGLDWTRQGIKALSLWFKGNPTGLKGSFELTAGTDAYYSANGPFDVTMNATGADIGDIGPNPYHDEFHYAYKRLRNSVPSVIAEGSIEARVDDVNNTNTWAKAGVMMRETLHVDSNYVSVVITPGQGVSLQYRDIKRGASSSFTQQYQLDGTTLITAPHWVRLSRDEWGFFHAEHANDVGGYPGPWISINRDYDGSQVTTDMTPDLYAGLCLTSHNAAQMCKAEFSDIRFSNRELEGHWFTGFWKPLDIGIISNDPELMYLALEDTSNNVGVVYYDTDGTPDPNAVLKETWTEWNINLANPNFAPVDMNFVEMVYIGFGDRGTPTPGGSGVVYFDDMRLYRSRFVPGYYPPIPGNIWRDPVTDLPDGVVDEKDLKVMAEDWLITDVCYPTSEPPIGPVAYWPLDEDDFDDYSGNGLHGDPCGASTFNDAERAWVATFDGDDYVDCGNPTDPCLLDFGTGDWTVSAWVKTTMLDTGGDDDKGVIYGKGGDTGGGHRYGLYVNENQGTPGRVTLIVDDDDTKVMVNSSVIVSNGEWHHAVGLRDGDDLRLYINGVLDANEALPVGYNLSGTHQHNAYIGTITDHDPNVLYKFLIGSVDDVQVYDYALSDAEAAYLATEGAAYLHIPPDSDADIYTHLTLEPPGKQAVNFRDFAKLANYWLEEELWWPPEP